MHELRPVVKENSLFSEVQIRAFQSTPQEHGDGNLRGERNVVEEDDRGHSKFINTLTSKTKAVNAPNPEI